MNGDAAKEDRLAVEEDLGATGFDGAEADLVFDFVRVGGDLNFIEFWVFGGPEAQGFDGEANGCAGVRIDRSPGFSRAIRGWRR